MGVEEAPAAQPNECYYRHNRETAWRAGEAVRQPLQTGRQPRLGTSPPQRMAQYQEEKRKRRPISPEAPRADPEPALPVHVGQRHCRTLRIGVEMILETQLRQLRT